MPPTATPDPLDGVPGTLPRFSAIWSHLAGRALAEAAANSLGVHWTTIYRWNKRGMVGAEAHNLLRVQALCETKLGHVPSAELLWQPSVGADDEP